MTYTGTLAVGESLIIDTDAMTATKGATNALQYVSGIQDLLAGDNLLTYTDSESARTVGIKVVHTPRDL